MTPAWHGMARRAVARDATGANEEGDVETEIPSLPRLAGEAYALAFREAPGYEARLWPDAALILTGEPEPWFNVAVLDHSPRAEPRLRNIVEILREHELPAVFFVDAAVAEPVAALASTLGLHEAGRTPWMILRPAAPGEPPAPSERTTVERVTSAAALRDAIAVAARTFRFSAASSERVWGPAVLRAVGVDVFLARHEGIAAATMMATRTGPVVGIWTMATLPGLQGQGIGRALIEYAVAYHVECGATLFYLGATDAGRPFYERMGFRSVSETSLLWLAPSTKRVRN